MKKVVLTMVVMALASVTAQADLVGWWAFNEGSGDIAYDSSGNDLHGLLRRGDKAFNESYDWGATIPDWTADRNGNPGSALLFGSPAGNNWNCVEVLYDPILEISTNWTIGFWVRNDSDGPDGWSGSYGRVISCPNYEIELGANGDNTSWFWPYVGGTSYSPAWDMQMANTPGLSQWYHMAVTFDGSSFIQYINGVPVFGVAAPEPSLPTALWQDNFDWANLRFGGQCTENSNGSFLAGALDDIVIFNETLDVAGVNDVMNGIIPEPMTLTLLGLGGLTLLRRRR